MREFKLHLEDDLLGRIQETAERAGLSTNQMIVNVLEENFRGQASFDYAAALAELVREGKSRPVGERFVLADLAAFSRLSVSTAEKGCVQPSAVRIRLGRTFNRTVSQGQAFGIARATAEDRDGKTVLRFLSGASVYVRALSVMVWNIHQQGGYGEGKIPLFVIDEIKKADIAILTEFCTRGPRCAKGREQFIQALEAAGYQCCVSDNGTGNDVLIAVRKEYPIKSVDWEPCYKGEDEDPERVPENLQVDIDVGGETVSVLGVRIKTTADFGMRRSQFAHWLLPRLSKIKNPVIVAGDFNNNRRGVEAKFDKDRVPKTQRWSIVQMDHMLAERFPDKKEAVIRKTPAGGSIFEAESRRGPEFECAEDHFLIRGLRCEKLFDYDRDFAKGKAGKERGYMLSDDFFDVPAGLPDHAILRGEFLLE